MPTANLPSRQAGLSKLVLIIIILVVLLLASGTGLALFFAGVIGGKPPQVVGADGTVQVVEEPEPPKAPIYVPLDPPLVVNFERKGRMGFLQATMQVMTREPAVQENISKHMPVIRNNLLMLLSAKTFEEVSTREGKELLRQEALAELNKVLEQQGVKGTAEDLYFTGFVMQ